MRNLTSLLILLALAPWARAELKTETVLYKDGDTVLSGHLAYDTATEGKRPGILVVHEWWGHDAYARSRAEQLARLGYVAFALDMYGKGVHAATAQDAARLSTPFRKDRRLMRRRARAGLEILRRHALADPERLAAIGYCFGGTVALELARDGAELAAVVSFHGGLATTLPAGKGAIRARVLVCNGADDSFVTDEELDAFRDEMREAGADWLLVHYGGAVHSFTNRGADSHSIPGVKYDEKADRRSWAHMLVHFREAFGR
jgi:dienelactone hydrolase